MTRFVRSLAITALVVAPSMLFAESSNEDLRREMEAIRKTQEAIQKDLQEIKTLLQQRPAPSARAERQPPSTIAIAGEPSKGDAKAKLVLVEFSDYQCPYCARYVNDTKPQIDEEYVKTGKLKYVFRDLPLSIHKNAFKAAEAAACASDQGKFWEMHDRLFANPKNLALEELPGHAEAIGLDKAKFSQCLDTGKYATAVQKDMDDARAAGISGTPAFLIGTVDDKGNVKVIKMLTGAQRFPAFKAAFDAALEPPRAAAK